MASHVPFHPVAPARPADWRPGWRSFFGERRRNSVFGWPEPAFDGFYHRRSVLGVPLHVVCNPDVLGHVLLDNKENWLRPRLVQRLLKPLLGTGLLSAEGDHWKQQRRIVAPTFAPGAVGKMATLIASAAQRQTESWASGQCRIDMAKAGTDATMAVIADALFSGDPRLLTSDANRHIDNLIQAGGQARLLTLLGLSDFDPSPTMKRARQGRIYLRQTLTSLVRERGPTGGADDFFGGLIRALHEHYPAEEAEELAVDNAITFYVAGHETTANALAWTIYLLAAQPGLQAQAREESSAALRGDTATLADRLPLLRQIIDEAMRLYPPAPNFSREAFADDDLGGVKASAGDLVSISPWLIHRHRKLWTNADAFDHSRFAPENKAKLHRFQYLPFGAGPRVCVGARFAIVEALIILAHWLNARSFALPPGFKPDPVGSVTLRPRGGMPLIMGEA